MSSQIQLNPNGLILDFEGPDVKYEDIPTSGKRRRPIEHIRTFYRKNDLSAILSLEESLEEMESLALPGDTYKLAFTPGLIDKVYKRPDPDDPDVKENLLPNPADVTWR